MRFWRGDAQSLEDAELSVELLQRTYPKLLSSWVLVGIYAVFVGYGASTIGIYLEHSGDALFRRADPWMLIGSENALGVHRAERARAAAL